MGSHARTHCSQPTSACACFFRRRLAVSTSIVTTSELFWRTSSPLSPTGATVASTTAKLSFVRAIAAMPSVATGSLSETVCSREMRALRAPSERNKLRQSASRQTRQSDRDVMSRIRHASCVGR
eukprot:4252298-Pleurochrysis_carterae.AAC.1